MHTPLHGPQKRLKSTIRLIGAVEAIITGICNKPFDFFIFYFFMSSSTNKEELPVDSEEVNEEQYPITLSEIYPHKPQQRARTDHIMTSLL